MAVDIDSLQIEIEATSSDAASKIEQLATALTNLKSAAKGGAGLTTTTKQLQALSNAAKLINGTNLNSQKIQQFANAMNSLSTIQKASGLNSTINALKKLPEISTALNKADLGKFAQQINQVASAMRPLATEMQKVANGFSAFPIRIQKIIQSNSALAASNNKAAKSFGVLGTGISSAKAKFGIYLIAFRQIASVMSDWVKESNDYVENLNLFTVAMGDYAAEAKVYAEEVQAAMGIDPSEWMRNQGVFMQMASGFGVATDSAALMSKNLTQLGYDISSFYNIGIEEAMGKLQSGLAGEIEPLRRLGYAIDVASLEQVALNHGITESVNAMTQAEKAQLRYVAIMEQSQNAMGDLSRTIQTPANAMRILNQQIIQLRRALGNMLIPILQQVIPWVQAFVEVLTEAAQAIANLLGFELPTIDYSGLEGVSVGASDASDALGEAADAAKKLQHYTIGIDELNIISPQQNAAADTGVGSAGGDLGLELPEYDFLNGLEGQLNDLKNTIKDLLYNYVIPVGTALSAWKILDLLQNLGIASSLIKDLKKSVAGGIVAYLEFQLALGAFNDFLSQDGDIWDFVRGALITAIGSGILYAMFGGPGLIIGLGIGLVASIVSLASNIMEGLDYNGPKATIMQIFSSILGGAIGWKIIGGFAGAAVGFSVTAGVVLTITSIAANLSGQAESGSLANALNIIISTIASGLGGAALTTALGVATGPIGFVIGAVLSFVIQGITMNWDAIVNSAVSWFKNLINELIQIANDEALSIPEKVTAIGFNIVLGIMDGIIGALSGILNWLNTNLVQPIVNGVKGLLGIHSPSTVFSEIGKNIIEGLLQGISFTWQSILDFFTVELPNWWNNTIVPWFTLDRWIQLASSIGEAIKTAWNSAVTQWKTDISTWWNEDVAKWFSLETWAELGKQAIDGLFSGLSNIWNTVSTWGENLLNDVKDVLGIHSPSVEFEVIGEYSVAGLKNGFNQIPAITELFIEQIAIMKQNAQLFSSDVYNMIDTTLEFLLESLATAQTEQQRFTDAVSLMYRNMAAASNAAIQSIISYLNSIPREITTVHTIITRNVGGGSSKSYASGGFPDTGQMFIAREAGPELVGTIGKRTAVANNAQIVAGISAGVEEANQSQNALLREQNELLRAILAKEGVTYVSDKQIKRAYDRASRNSGASIMVGGVVG